MKSDGSRIVWGGIALFGNGLFLAMPAVTRAEAIWQVQIPAVDLLLGLLANPNVAYILFVLGLLGLVAEFVTAGSVFPGTMGTISLILALVGLGQLPTNWAGAALIAAGIVMFLLDIKVTGFGLSVGGVVAFGLGSLLIFTPFWVPNVPEISNVRLNPWLIAGTTGGVTVFFMWGVSMAVKAQFAPLAMGRETMIGKQGIVRQRLNPAGIVHVEGEEWSAVAASGEEIPVGASVRVVGADGLTLRVEPVVGE